MPAKRLVEAPERVPAAAVPVMYLRPGAIRWGTTACEPWPSRTRTSVGPAVAQPADHGGDVAHEILPGLLVQRRVRLAGLRELEDAADPLQIGHDVDLDGSAADAGTAAGSADRIPARRAIDRLVLLILFLLFGGRPPLSL